jgi:beta-lactamase superfamily II metal-dependent hydrolase
LVFALIYFFAYAKIFPPNENGEVILPVEEEIIISFLDVGQGDAIVIRSAENAVLIDGGDHRRRAVVMEYLQEAEISRLCYVIATHPHSDHIGALPTVLRDLEVGGVIMPDVSHNTDTFENFLEAIENNNIPVRMPVPGEVISAGIIELTVISPPRGHPPSINNGSLVLRLEFGDTSFLFTGDAETPAEDWMLENPEILASNVLKIGHHGSRTSTGEAFLDAVAPSIAVIQVGATNQYGHPHPEVIERLEARDIAIYRTDQLGTIRMITNGTEISRH